MAINKKLIHFNSKENFENKVANNEILDTSIAFVKDSKEIWTHGNLYKSVNWGILERSASAEHIKKLTIHCEWGSAKFIVDLSEATSHWTTNANSNYIVPDGSNLYLMAASGNTTIDFETNTEGFTVNDEPILIDSVTSITNDSIFSIDLPNMYNVGRIYIGGA